MSVNILLVTHNNVGQALLDAATITFGELPLKAKAIAIHAHDDPTHCSKQIQKQIQQLDDGAGVVILTDIFGSTPSNIAQTLLNNNTRLIAGINLPMLIRMMNYPNLSLEEMVKKAVSGGREGIIECVASQTLGKTDAA